MFEVLNLGAGVQSSYLLFRHGKDIDHAVFSDTGWEPPAVYEWLETVLKPVCEDNAVKLHVVSRGHIKEDAERVQAVYQGKTKDGDTRWGSMPYYVLNPNGSIGIVRRQCTYEYKVRAVEKCIREDILGLAPKQRGKPGSVRQWFGISFDERQRMRVADKKWTEFYYPLVENKTSRAGCMQLFSNLGLKPPRSACIGCPYHSDAEWREMKRDRPAEFEEACQFDETMRSAAGMRGELYLHGSCKPLREIDFRNDFDRGQLPLFADECSGMCGN